MPASTGLSAGMYILLITIDMAGGNYVVSIIIPPWAYLYRDFCEDEFVSLTLL